MKTLLTLLFTTALLTSSPAEESPPNVLFISIDDLNDWIGCMGGNKQSITPNFDRLAASGMLFTNAHCIAPACNPSRTALMTGRSPHKTGVYANAQKMRDVLPDETLLPKYFSDHGYWSAGSGKILHYVIDPQSWDEYFPKKESDDPLPFTLYPEERPVSLKRGGPWQYVETDWGSLDATDEEFGGDYSVSEWVGEQLSKTHDKPFFLACGIYRPHEPWFVPEKYFKKFPIESIALPPAYKKDDLEDLSIAGKNLARNRYFDHIQSQGQWKNAIQGYLASIHFADAMLGRVLDALENGPNKNNTIVVLWSDHGWHLGSKEHWQKFTTWRQCTRVPLMFRIPAGISDSLPAGTSAGSICDQPVSLISLFPTLTELCGLPGKEGVDGNSIVPLLNDPQESVDPVAITYLHHVGSVGISGKDWRYIKYHGGDEELYHIREDPYEWNNLANDPKYADRLAEFREHYPKQFAPLPEVKARDLNALKWVPFTDGQSIPPSLPDGGNMRLEMFNRCGITVKVFRLNKDDEKEQKAELQPGKHIRLISAPGVVWLITSPDDEPLGYFVHGDRAAKAIIPPEAGE